MSRRQSDFIATMLRQRPYSGGLASTYPI